MIILRESPQAKGRVQIQIDPADVMLYASRCWCLCTRARDGIILLCRKTNLQFHRAILDARDEEMVRFINGDRLDFRRQNLLRVTRAELNASKRGKPNFVRAYSGRAPSVCFYNRKQVRGGCISYERVVRATFCFKRKRQAKDVSVDRHGLQEAVRIALAWRMKMLSDHGQAPTDEMLEVLDRSTRMARAGGGFEEVYGGSALYENSVVQPWETCHWADNREPA